MKIPAQAKKVFEGKIFDVYQWEQKMFDGSYETFEMLKRPYTAQVLATVGDKILIIHDEQPNRAEMIAFPGGRINEGEEPLVGAKRELLEETGYTSDEWQLLAEVQPIGKIDWSIFTYIARNATFKQEPHLDAGERIKVSLVSFDEFIRLAIDANLRISPEYSRAFIEAQFNENKKTELQRELGL